MSDLPLDLQEQVARIDRAQAETRKFSAEQNKLTEEALKFRNERHWYVPVALLSNAAVAAAVAAIVAKLIH